MSKFVIHNCVMKGFHAYYPAICVGDVYHCKPECNNVYDPNAVCVVNTSNQVIGHMPFNVCNFVKELYLRYPEKIFVLW